MQQLSLPEIELYSHSPVHHAVARHDYAALKKILATLPSLPKAGEIKTEEESATAEAAADTVSSVVDRRDVPNRETPLHLAVRLGDAASVELLMAAGADWSLQNEQGWSALQEAVCAREEGIAMIITRYYQPLAWAKWCRRLPRITGSMRRLRDFYMEITFNFESSVIPFIGRIAPSDTYRIWKRGSNLRADMTLAGFDGFKIQRSEQSFLFLGDGTEDGKIPPGSLLVLTHKDKEVTNALEGAGAQPSETEIAQEVAVMSQTNMYRPGIDVTQADLVPQLTWRRQEKTEMVGLWKTKVFDMHHVHISVRSRRVPGALSDEHLFSAESDAQADLEDDYAELLTEEEKQQLDNALNMEGLDLSEDDNEDVGSTHGVQRGGTSHSQDFAEDNGERPVPTRDENGSMGAHSGPPKEQKKGWFGRVRKGFKEEGGEKNKAGIFSKQQGSRDAETPGFNSDTTGVDKSYKQGTRQNTEGSRLSVGSKASEAYSDDSSRKSKEANTKRNGLLKNKHNQNPSSNGNNENEYRKGLRPVLWLTPDFPLKTDEFLPLLDILANKVKAVRRLRELLTTKLPPGTFPVKVAIPIVPTIRVVVTFNKFEEVSTSEEFGTPLSSPTHFPDSKGKDPESSNSWLSWIRGSGEQSASTSISRQDYVEDIDPFSIPSDYTWIDMKEKKRRLKMRKSKMKKTRKPPSRVSEVTGRTEPVE
ncbi:hypothetical protein KP509_19G053700 [Ceratopteris richardii]|uniref:Ankyrin repeat domain-containing protein n=1 Tax=Ceratopteris richardii TaxID=49495 RepID=A0A8T2SP08_CERRI|nr:hypothetical protein KP509_19G053700 [Ceratopteris richardii]KAH7352604.1 hypothetical protein KP509_19G053700 [Ceratopteris richardii]